MSTRDTGQRGRRRRGTTRKRAAIVAAIVLSLAACSRSERWIGAGDVIAVDEERAAVTIRHDEVPNVLGAATTRFPADRADLIAGLAIGSRVRFELTRRAEGLVLTRLRLLSEGSLGMHDHTPHHGGVVAMAGMIHLEARAERGGEVEVYLTDRWRRPLPLVDTSGSVTLRLADGSPEVPLRVEAGALRAQGPALSGREVNAHVQLVRHGEPVDVHFVLPLDSDAPGAAGVPPQGCAPVSAAEGGERRPRCVLTFPSPVAALATTADGSTLLVAVVGFGVTAWRLPAAELVRGFASPPPIRGPADEPPHVEAANAIAIHPDGTIAIVAYEGRLIRYAIRSGEVLSAWQGPGGVIRDVSWSPDGAELLVSAFYDRTATLFDGDTGSPLRRFAVDREGAGVAFSPVHDAVAVSSESGPIAVFERHSGRRLALLAVSARPSRALVFAGELLLAAGDEGILRVWTAIDPPALQQSAAAAPIQYMALSPDGARVATAGFGGAIRIHELPSARVVETIAWHDSQIRGLTWTSGLLVSADAKGRVALWNF
jgi:WD40 repeat protein/Cu/Ag efflux protein CusF